MRAAEVVNVSALNFNSMRWKPDWAPNASLFLRQKVKSGAPKSGLLLKVSNSVRVRAEGPVVVGIDLGTTNSAVAAMVEGRPSIVPNDQGQRTTPSAVAYSNIEWWAGEIYVGECANILAFMNPDNTFFSARRFIGKKMAEVEDEDTNRVTYTIVRDDVGNVKFECPAIGKQISAVEISAQILKKLVDDASKSLNAKVSKAVITVPTYFNHSQRMATQDAARMAGLEVLRLISEPTAAVLAYGFDNKTILVFDLGGATFDVSVIKVADGVFQVLSTSGDLHLGGNDFDKRIVDWLVADFKRDQGIDLSEDPFYLQRLTDAAVEGKMELSSSTQTNISLPCIDGLLFDKAKRDLLASTQTELSLSIAVENLKDLDTTLTRAKFEELCSDLLERLQTSVEKALTAAKLSYNDLDEVILVGGSTRIPAVQSLVKKMTGKEANVSINPDEVVALGAAMQASVLLGNVSDITHLDA